MVEAAARSACSQGARHVALLRGRQRVVCAAEPRSNSSSAPPAANLNLNLLGSSAARLRDRLRRDNSSFNGPASSFDSADWAAWQAVFTQSDTREALIAALEAQLAAAVATQDFEAASCVSAARAAVLASDDAAAFLGAFADATRREDFPAAAALRDAGAGLVGWWAGVDEAAPSAPGHSPTGVLLRIAPRFGRLVGTAHAPGEPGVSASSFWAVAAARAAGAPLPSASDGVRLAAQPAPSPVIELHVVSRAAEAGGCGFATTAAVLVPPEGGLAPLGLRPPAGDDGLDDADDGGGVVNITVFLSGKESPDDAAAQLGAALASTLAATPPDTGAALGAGGARRRGGRRRGAARRGALARPPPGADASSRSDEDDDDTAEEDGEEEGEEGEEEEEEDTDSGLSPEDRAPPPPPPPRRAPATLTRVGRDTFTLEYSAAAPDERDVVAGARAASLSRSAPAAPDRRAQLLAAVRQVAAATLSGAKGRISVTLGSPTSPFPFASFPLAAAAAAAAMAGSSPRSPALPCRCVFRRIPPSCLDSPTDPLSGLATGIFGPHGTETLLLRRGAWGYEPGEGDAPPAAECFTAFKLTGDKHVPAGRASFRARVGRGHRLAHADAYPAELGVTARYKGQGRAAGPGFANPHWVDGELLVLDGRGVARGARVGFVWHVPGEKRFLILLHRLVLPDN